MGDDTKSSVGRPLVVVSPHLDDAALSTVATLACWPGPRVVVTLFSGDPPPSLTPTARALHAAWRLDDDASRARRAEDRAACAELGATAVHLGLPDAIYRRRRDGSPVVGSERDLFCATDDGEQALTARAAALVDAWLAPDAAVLAPLGVGGHRDHRIARAAAELASRPLAGYYEEQPYGWWGRSAPVLPAGWRRRLHPLSPDALDLKLRAVGCYASQVRTLWDDRWRDALLRDHARRGAVFVEQIWWSDSCAPPPVAACR